MRKTTYSLALGLLFAFVAATATSASENAVWKRFRGGAISLLIGAFSSVVVMRKTALVGEEAVAEDSDAVCGESSKRCANDGDDCKVLAKKPI